MKDLLILHKTLATAVNANPVLRLAHLTAWLDPLWNASDDLERPESEDDTLINALHILRRAFPDIYFDALQAMRNDAAYQQIDTLICDAVQAQGIPLESLEWLPYGIPLPAYGVDLSDPEFYTVHPDALPVLACFGIAPEPNPYHMVIPEITHTAAKMLAADLMQQEDERWRQVAWLLRWLFSFSQNSSVDWDENLMAEVQPLSWEADDIAFARAIITKADEIMSNVLEGLAFINANENAMQALHANVGRVYRVIEKQRLNISELSKVQFEWETITQ